MNRITKRALKTGGKTTKRKPGTRYKDIVKKRWNFFISTGRNSPERF